MKKVLVIFGLILLAVIVIIAFFLIWASNRKFVPGNYTKRVETGGEIEAAYLEAGPYGVSMYEEAVMQGFKKLLFTIPPNWRARRSSTLQWFLPMAAGVGYRNIRPYWSI